MPAGVREKQKAFRDNAESVLFEYLQFTNLQQLQQKKNEKTRTQIE